MWTQDQITEAAADLYEAERSSRVMASFRKPVLVPVS